jgi:hypothetical protein
MPMKEGSALGSETTCHPPGFAQGSDVLESTGKVTSSAGWTESRSTSIDSTAALESLSPCSSSSRWGGVALWTFVPSRFALVFRGLCRINPHSFNFMRYARVLLEVSKMQSDCLLDTHDALNLYFCSISSFTSSRLFFWLNDSSRISSCTASQSFVMAEGRQGVQLMSVNRAGT